MKLDDFESVFRSAVKTQFHHKAPIIESALLVTDVEEAETEAMLEQVRVFLSKTHNTSEIEWSTLNSGDFSEVAEVLDRVRRNPPSIVVCYRHILGQGSKLPYSLGSTVDTLTQATDVPVLLLPRPDNKELCLPKSTDQVMVVTDHLTGDDRLVNWAAHLCTLEGTLYLTHVEDESVLAHYIDVMSKIPGIGHEVVETKLPEKLLQIPLDYIQSTAEVLAKDGDREKVEPVVVLGDPVTYYEKLVVEKNVDLLVMNTKDAGQSAMHALAYALAVEIRDRPLLLL